MNPQKSITGQLVDYIKTNLAKGYNQDTLRFSLMSQGYSRITVDNAIDRAHKELSVKLPLVKEKPQITYKIVDEQNRPIKIVDIPIEKNKSFFKSLMRHLFSSP